MDRFMSEAIKEAYSGIDNYDGGPFGSVIINNQNVIVGRGHNRVIKNNDCTCHGEMEAIRDACKNLGTFDLSGCKLYTTSYPCPMCSGAILWANIDKVYYGCNVQDAEEIGFRDKSFEEFLGGDTGSFFEEVDRSECKDLFKSYKEKPYNTAY